MSSGKALGALTQNHADYTRCWICVWPTGTSKCVRLETGKRFIESKAGGNFLMQLAVATAASATAVASKTRVGLLIYMIYTIVFWGQRVKGVSGPTDPQKMSHPPGSAGYHKRHR